MIRINPIWLLIAFNVLFFVARDWLLPEGALQQFSASMEGVLASLGPLGHAALVATFALCGFFFVPLLIPLNIFCGAIYGPVNGTVLSMAGIVAACYASTISVRSVFTGMQRTIDRNGSAQKVLRQIERHGSIVVIVVRLAFVVPYLIQNIVLAVTPIGMHRLALLTAVGALPAAAIYSFLGAGLMQTESARELAVYLTVPMLMLVAISLLVRHLNRKYSA